MRILEFIGFLISLPFAIGESNVRQAAHGTGIFVDPAILAAAIAFLSVVIRDSVDRAKNVRSMNTAVLAEVQRLLNVVERHREWWNNLDANARKTYPLIQFTYPIYKKQAKNIGRLRPTIAEKVAKFFGYLEFLNSLQATRPQYLAAEAF